jgi:lysozyme family protein
VDVWDLSDDMIKSFYLLQNWLPIKGKFIGDQRLADFLFSMSVLEGVSAAVKRLQGILQVTADGIMGTKTLEAIESEDEDSLIRRYGAANLAFYKAIVKHDPTQQRFLAGWTARLNHYEAMT